MSDETESSKNKRGGAIRQKHINSFGILYMGKSLFHSYTREPKRECERATPRRRRRRSARQQPN